MRVDIENLNVARGKRQTNSWTAHHAPAGSSQALGDVVGLLGERVGVIDAQRPERRIPDQARAGRGTHARELAICCDGDSAFRFDTLEAPLAHRLPTSENKAIFNCASAGTSGTGACNWADEVQ